MYIVVLFIMLLLLNYRGLPKGLLFYGSLPLFLALLLLPLTPLLSLNLLIPVSHRATLRPVILHLLLPLLLLFLLLLVTLSTC